MVINRNAALVVAIGIAVAAVAAYLALTVRKPAPPPASSAPPPAPQAPQAKTNADDAFMADTVKGVVAEDVAYFGSVKGVYARPSEGGPYPGVVMIHEWWGLNDGIRAMARRLAGQGYAVLAVDLYDGKVAATPDEATALVKALDQKRAIDNMRAAVAYLRGAGAKKVASLGWCFGGGQSLQLALAERLDATVLYYGSPLITEKDRLKAIAWPVLGIFGDKDAVISVDSVHAFDEALSDLGIDHEVRLYAGVGHAFANPSGPNFSPDKTRDAWIRTVAFLKKYLH